MQSVKIKFLRSLKLFSISYVFLGLIPLSGYSMENESTLKAFFPSKQILSFEEWEVISNKLSDQLQGLQEWKGLIAVARGGLIPAWSISKKLKITNIKTINIQSYENCQQLDQLTLGTFPNIDNNGQGWLIVDDISDTGRTFKIIQEMFPEATYAALVVKPEGKEVTNFWGEEVDQSTWVVFPWEHQFNID